MWLWYDGWNFVIQTLIMWHDNVGEEWAMSDGVGSMSGHARAMSGCEDSMSDHARAMSGCGGL